MENKPSYVVGFWSQLKFWFTMRRLRKEKIQYLWEAEMDKHFYETHYNDELNYNDAADREALAAENRLPRAEQDPIKIMSLEEKISRSKSVKELYRKNQLLRQEFQGYVELLDAWLNQN